MQRLHVSVLHVFSNLHGNSSPLQDLKRSLDRNGVKAMARGEVGKTGAGRIGAVFWWLTLLLALNALRTPPLSISNQKQFHYYLALFLQ